MWLGGWLVAAVAVAHVRDETTDVRATTFGVVAKAFTTVIVPGAILTMGSGIMWSMALVNAGAVQSRVTPIGVIVMTAAGFVGGLLIVFVALPTAVKLRAVAVPTPTTQMLPVFEHLRKRLVVVSLVAGVLAALSLFGSVIAP
jgi:hypothetical protein